MYFEYMYFYSNYLTSESPFVCQ